MKISEIKYTAAVYFGVPQGKMESPERAWRYSHPRQVAMALARELTTASLPQIGKQFGRRDHTTVLNAIRAVNRRGHKDDLSALRAILAKSADERTELLAKHVEAREKAMRQALECEIAALPRPLVRYAGFDKAEHAGITARTSEAR